MDMISSYIVTIFLQISNLCSQSGKNFLKYFKYIEYLKYVKLFLAEILPMNLALFFPSNHAGVKVTNISPSFPKVFIKVSTFVSVAYILQISTTEVSVAEQLFLDVE